MRSVQPNRGKVHVLTPRRVSRVASGLGRAEVFQYAALYSVAVR